MYWDRTISINEYYLVEILLQANRELNIHEIACEIKKTFPSALTGNTPHKSLYSIIYRREKRRKKKGDTLLLNINKRGSAVYYSLNHNNSFVKYMKENQFNECK